METLKRFFVLLAAFIMVVFVMIAKFWKEILLIIIFMVLMNAVICGCEYTGNYEFEYVYFKFNDGTDTTFYDCGGGIYQARGESWFIIRDENGLETFITPMTSLKNFHWRYKGRN